MKMTTPPKLVQFQPEGNANKGTKKTFEIDEGSSRIDIIAPDSKKNENLNDKCNKSNSKEEVPKKQCNFQKKKPTLKPLKEDSTLVMILKCLLAVSLEVGDLVTNIMTLNSFYETQQFGYFGT